MLGQAYPYTPIANPRYFVPGWTFGIQEARLQKLQVDGEAVVREQQHRARARRARLVDQELKGKAMRADRRYKVTGWAPVAEGATGEPVWELVGRHLPGRKRVPAQAPNRPIILS